MSWNKTTRNKAPPPSYLQPLLATRSGGLVWLVSSWFRKRKCTDRVGMCVYVCVCVCIYIYMHTHDKYAKGDCKRIRFIVVCDHCLTWFRYNPPFACIFEVPIEGYGSPGIHPMTIRAGLAERNLALWDVWARERTLSTNPHKNQCCTRYTQHNSV